MAEGTSGAADPFSSLLGDITEEQWEAYKALKKNRGGLVQDDSDSLDSSSEEDEAPPGATGTADDAEKLRSVLTNKYINGEITFAEFTDGMDSSLSNREGGLKDEDDAQEDAFLRPRLKKSKGGGTRLPRDLQGLMGEANLCFARGRHDDAVKMCMEVVRLAPRAPEPFQTLGMVYEAKGEPQRALQFALIGAYLSPQDAEEWSRLGQLSLEQGDLKQATACYVQAVRAEPSNAELRFELCSLYEQAGEKKRALACCTALVQQMGQGAPCLQLSRELVKVHHQRGNLSAARQVLLNAVLKFPAHVSSEDINMLLELQLTDKMYPAALMVLHSHCGVKLLPEGGQELSEEMLVDKLSAFERCEVPEELPVDLRTKLVLCLVRLGGNHLAEPLVEALQRDQDPEQAGDLLLDVAEAFLDEGQPARALPLLQALVRTKNYGLAAVWLRYGECLQLLGRLSEATEAYERTCDLAPSHAHARLALCQLLLAQGLTDRAIACLDQPADGDGGHQPFPTLPADTSEQQQEAAQVLLRRAQLLLQSGRREPFIESARVLLQAHCPAVQSPAEYTAMYSTSSYRGRMEALRELHQKRGFTPLNWLTAENGVSVDDLWDCYRELCRALYETNRLKELQQVTTEALVSPIFNRDPVRTKELEFTSFLAHYRDPTQEEHSFYLARSLVLKYPERMRVWNLFGLAVNLSPVMRQNRFCLRLLYKYPDSYPLGLLNGHNALVSGTYKHALAEYVQLLQQPNQADNPLLLLCAGLCMVHIACQKFSARRHWMVVQAVAFLGKYRQARGLMTQEALYNVGRALHQMGLPHLASQLYRQALEQPPAVPDMPEIFDLRREIAFNLSQLYLSSGNTELASSYISRYCII
ncbi:general transcription factor 3C polypeptide 3 [Haemaphysalis longicornis]